MLKTCLSAVAAMTFVATPALAADFTGPRAELKVGFDKTTLDLDYTDGFTRLTGSGHDSGVALGAEFGFDAVMGNALVAGAYAGIEGSTTEDCLTDYDRSQACLHIGRNFTAGGRLGALVSPSLMVYGKAGYSNGQVRFSYEDPNFPADNFRFKFNRSGYHVGGGLEAAIGQSTYVRAEYVRTNYNDYREVDGSESLTLDGHRDQGMLGFGLRF